MSTLSKVQKRFAAVAKTLLSSLFSVFFWNRFFEHFGTPDTSWVWILGSPGRDKGRGKPLPLGIEGMNDQGLKGFRDQRHKRSKDTRDSGIED